MRNLGQQKILQPFLEKSWEVKISLVKAFRGHSEKLVNVWQEKKKLKMASVNTWVLSEFARHICYLIDEIAIDVPMKTLHQWLLLFGSITRREPSVISM